MEFYMLLLNSIFIQSYNRRIKMDEINDQEPTKEITVKKPFQVKFFQELNCQNEGQKHNPNSNQKNQSRSFRQTQRTIDGEISSHVGFGSKQSEEMVMKNGNRIRANWKNGQIDGQAEIYYGNGVVFKGLYKNGSKVRGHFKFLNGYEYIGNCLGNKFYGEGSLIFPSGKTISGEWREYTLIGSSKIQYPHGQVYYGQIQNLKKHGNGSLYMNDGSKYVGEFWQGCISGQGTYYVNDRVVSKGEWVNGELVRSEPISQINETSIVLGHADDSEDLALKDKKSKHTMKGARITSIAQVLKMHQNSTKTTKKTVKFIE